MIRELRLWSLPKVVSWKARQEEFCEPGSDLDGPVMQGGRIVCGVSKAKFHRLLTHHVPDEAAEQLLVRSAERDADPLLFNVPLFARTLRGLNDRIRSNCRFIDFDAVLIRNFQREPRIAIHRFSVIVGERVSASERGDRGRRARPELQM